MKNRIRKAINVLMCLIILAGGVTSATKVEAENQLDGYIKVDFRIVDENGDEIQLDSTISNVTSVQLFYCAPNEESFSQIYSLIMPPIGTGFFGTYCEGDIFPSDFLELHEGTYYLTQGNAKEQTTEIIYGAENKKYEFVRTEYKTFNTEKQTGKSPDYYMSDYGGTFEVYLVYKEIPNTRDIDVKVVWDDANNQDGKRPQSTEITLWTVGDGESGNEEKESKYADASNDWKIQFNDYATSDGDKKIKCTVTSEDLSEKGYTSKVTGSAEDGFTITLTHTPETVQVKGVIYWMDSIRPDNITVNLFTNGQHTETKNVERKIDATTSFDFGSLPKYKDGRLINYSISAVDTDEFNYTVYGFDIDCYYIPQTTSRNVEIRWNDNENENKARPSEVEVTLVSNGVTADKKLTLNEENNWYGQFAELDKKTDDNNPIEYTVTGATVKNYKLTSEYDEDSEKYILTYTYQKEEVPPTENTPTNNGGNNNGNGTDTSLSPNTGDSNSAGLWASLMGISMLAFIGVLNKKYRIKKQ